MTLFNFKISLRNWFTRVERLKLNWGLVLRVREAVKYTFQSLIYFLVIIARYYLTKSCHFFNFLKIHSANKISYASSAKSWFLSYESVSANKRYVIDIYHDMFSIENKVYNIKESFTKIIKGIPLHYGQGKKLLVVYFNDF